MTFMYFGNNKNKWTKKDENSWKHIFIWCELHLIIGALFFRHCTLVCIVGVCRHCTLVCIVGVCRHCTVVCIVGVWEGPATRRPDRTPPHHHGLSPVRHWRRQGNHTYSCHHHGITPVRHWRCQSKHTYSCHHHRLPPVNCWRHQGKNTYLCHHYGLPPVNRWRHQGKHTYSWTRSSLALETPR